MPPATSDTGTSRLYGGFRALPAGIDMGTDPSLLPDGQAAFASNISFRGDLPITRPPLMSIPLDTTLTGLFAGAAFYETRARQGLMLVVAGRMYFIDVLPTDTGVVTDITPSMSISTTADFTVPAPAGSVVVAVSSETPFTTGDIIFIDSGEYTITNRAVKQLTLTYVGGAANAIAPAGSAVLDANQSQVIESNGYPATLDFVHIFQAERYGIFLGLQQKPVIFDGAMSRFAHVGEIPSGVMGLYAWGRIWVTLADFRTFAAGDIVYGPSGTPAQGFVDAILKFTENDFLNEGGFFAVPNNAGSITAMIALATIDTSLGIGPILIGTTNSMVSVNAPVDRTTWKNLTYPIQTISLLDYGPTGPYSTISVNNDVWFRSLDGVRSFIIARRNTLSPGNTPLSHEVSPVLDNDTDHLLFHGSAVLFGNRVYVTVAPRATVSGVVHDGLATINFDSLSTITGKQPPIWEGFTSGLAVLQVVRGRIAGSERAFAFALNEGNGRIELWELMRDGRGYYDTYRSVANGETAIVRTSIGTVLETKRYDYDRLVKLVMAELYLDEIVDEITLTVKFRPDEYPAWLTWATINLCASVSQCTIGTPENFTCHIWKPKARGYAARIRLPRPPETCNELAGTLVDRGYGFQFRLEGTGHFQTRKFRPHLKVESDAYEGTCPESAVCTSFEHCPDGWFTYAIDRGTTAPVLTLNIESTSSNIIVEWSQDGTPDTNEVWRSVNGGAFASLGVVAGNVTTFTDTNAMAPMDVWCYKVRGVRDGSPLQFSNEGCAVKDMFFLETGAVSHPTWMLAFGDFGADNPPAITSLDLRGMLRVRGNLFMDGMTTLVSFDLRNLLKVDLEFSLAQSAMTTASLPSLTHILAGDFNIQLAPNLNTLSAPVLVAVGGDIDCPGPFPVGALVNVNLGSFIMANGRTYSFDNNSLSAASVNHILARGIASGITSATIDTSGGVAAAPTGTGVLDKAALIIAGNTVTTN